jgi:hypothetical protein
MRRTLLVVFAMLFGTGLGLAQTGTATTGTTPTAQTGTTETPVKKKKKGREWGRFSSARVTDSSNESDKPKVGTSPRME